MSLFQKVYAFLWNLLAMMSGTKDPKPVVVTPVNPPPPNPTPVKIDRVATLTKLILARNGSFTSWYPSSVAPTRVPNAQIHKLTAAQAAQVAQLMVGNADAEEMDLVFIAAVSFQESQWDPACFNHNLVEHKGVNTFAGTDWGFGQNSGAQLLYVPAFAGLTEAAKIAKAEDPTWAVPYFVQNYKGLLTWARATLNTVGLNPTQLPGQPAVTNTFTVKEQIHRCISDVVILTPTTTDEDLAKWLAALGYNAGRHGALQCIADQGFVVRIDPITKQVTKIPKLHGHHVQVWIEQFTPVLDG